MRDDLRNALKVFADLGVGSGPDHETETYQIERGAIRKARAALESKPVASVDAVLAELMDRRLLNDVDDDLHQEIAEAVIKAARGISD
jgi:hypothetical protein